MENENAVCAPEHPARRPVLSLPKVTIKILCSLSNYYGTYHQITMELTIKSQWNLLLSHYGTYSARQFPSKYYDHYQITVETENAMCVPERPAWRAGRPLPES